MKVTEGAEPDLAHRVRERIARMLAEQAPRPEPADDVEEYGEDDDLGPDAVDRLPIRPRGFGRFGPAHLAVIAVVAVLGLAVAGWAVLRAQPVSLATPVPQVQPESQPPEPSTGPPATPGATPAVIMVHVVGAVRRPGLVTLPERSRVADAIERAGGLTREADPDRLNLAQVLADGQQVVIGTRADPAGEVRDGGGTNTGGGDPAGGGGQVDLNTATQSQLEALPGVGPVTAGKIIAWREQHGRFSRVEELQEVDGIGPKTFAQLAPHVRV
ncbi:helix-hairpin-helix domain-containing protein [Microlunatus parietis]|uniref:Competence protein ComEA n=1 Tax=Microlunatus parietis TaxID=682979 RepID=A0A7Y9IE18_9ACTN|nr:helix-hairpin-helix domain-containing protein [Microlunatus parietis]NYE75022.1 competence protein ComEA [Microlunatus parietis]